MDAKNDATLPSDWKLGPMTSGHWINALQDSTDRDQRREDQFARTFLSKADLQELWDSAFGVWQHGVLLGGLCWNLSKRKPHVANLQLLHTFYHYRRQGVGRLLCLEFLQRAIRRGAEYFRVSSERPAVEFYRKLGIVFLGEQKSGTLLSVGKCPADWREATFWNCRYDLNDPVVQKAVSRKGKGGCVTVFSPEGPIS